MKFRTRYEQFEKPGIDTGTITHTKQHFKDECDINLIMKKYKQKGILPDMIRAEPKYGDFSDVGTYQDAVNLVLTAQEQFGALSSQVRDRFNNDPASFLAFTNDPRNGEEMVRMGLATKKEKEAPEAPKAPKKEKTKNKDTLPNE